MAVTIKDVARAAGVSRGTVDRVLNGRGGVRPDVERRIKKLLAELHYTPNRAGRVLAALKKPVKIGCLLPGVGNRFFEDIVLGFRQAERELSDFGISLAVSEVRGFDPDVHVRAVDALLEKGISGLCVSTVDVPMVRGKINAVAAAGIPVVTVNSDLTRTRRLCYVGCDYLESGRTAAGVVSLLRGGPLEILILTGSFRMQGHNRRIAGFLRALEERKRTFHVAEIAESRDDDATSYARTLAALKKHPEVNCLYITSAGAYGVCRAVEELGRGDRITVLCFDDIPSTKRLVLQGKVPATICQDPFRQGYDSVKILYEYLVNGRPPARRRYFTDSVIKIRENILSAPAGAVEGADSAEKIKEEYDYGKTENKSGGE